MAYYFSMSDILSLAAENEVAGEVFYAGLATISPTEDVRKILTFLSDQEKNHQTAFLEMAKQMGTLEREQEYAIDIMAEMRAAIREMQERAFTPPSGILDTTSLTRAIDIGINTETVSITVYSAMEHSFTDQFKPVLNAIIAAEHSHLMQLTALKDSISPVTA
jgi:rubrerythrin